MVMTNRAKSVTSDDAQDTEGDKETTRQMMPHPALTEVIRTENQGDERMETRSNHQTVGIRNHMIIIGVAIAILTLIIHSIFPF